MSEHPSGRVEDRRDEILARVRAASAAVPAPPVEQPTRTYEVAGQRPPAERIALFEERLIDYDARVHRTMRAGLAAEIGRVLSASGRGVFAAPAGLPSEWQSDRFRWLRDNGSASLQQIEGVEGVVTAASIGIASTGTIILQHGPAEGRRVLTLLPDYHLCIVLYSQVVETVPEAFARIDPRALATFISGPSATADIEMTRIKGVHGPRLLEVMLVDDAGSVA